MPGKRAAKSASALDVTVGRNVRIWRMARGLSQSQLANRLGITFQQVQKYEVGGNRVPTGRLVRIAAILRVPIGMLFTGTDRAGADAALLSLVSDARSFRLAQAFAAIKNNQFRLSLVALVERIAAAEAAKRSRK